MQVSVVTRIEDLQKLKAEWDDLHSSDPDATPFADHSWICTWARTYLHSGEKPRVILVRDRERLVGLAPLFLTSRLGVRVLHPLGIKQLTGGEFVHLLMRPAYADAVCALVAGALMERAPEWDVLSLWGIRADSITQRVLFTQGQGLLQATTTITSFLGPAPVIRFEGGWDDYLARRSKRFRKHHRHNLAACQAAGIEVFKESELPGHQDLLERLIRVEACTWQGTREVPVLRNNEPFFRQILPGMVISGQADVVWAVHEGCPLAFVIYLFRKERVFLYMTGYDSSWAHLSPGMVVHAWALEDLCLGGIREVDFIMDWKQSSWKRQWAGDYEVSLNHVLVRKSLPGRLIGACLCLVNKP